MRGKIQKPGKPSRKTDAEWKWRKNYRVWDADRKIFLYPGNWIEPELRLPARFRASLNDVAVLIHPRCSAKGVRMLLTGKSRTRRLLTAQTLARDLGKDLYRIDVNAVVSKYIGETEKNLGRVFDSAKNNQVVLFFDEADALFGKRTDVKNSHDRNANIEIKYLLRRAGKYGRLTILGFLASAPTGSTKPPSRGKQSTAHSQFLRRSCARHVRPDSALLRWINMRRLILGLVLGLGCSAFGQMAPVADRVAKQNALFEEFYQTGLKNAPERATAYGDYRYNSQLAQYSLAEIARQHAEADGFLARLKAIPTDGMSDTDLLSHRILEKQLERYDVNYALKNYEMPVHQQSGVHTQLADLPNAMPFDSVPHYQDYISRLHQIPRVLEQTTEVMRQGMKDGLMPPKLVVEKLPGQCDGIIAANPFLEPTKKFPAEFSEADKKRLTDEITKAVNDDVFPAYKKFAEFLRNEYDPKGRPELSIETLDDGKRRYSEAVKTMTTIDTPPAEIHEIGLKEVARITAEMTKIAQSQGYKDLTSFREAVNNDPKWKPTSEQQILDDYRKYIHQMEPKLPELFGLLPKSPVTVEPIPDFAKAAATHYVQGTPDGKRPGRVVVAVSNPTKRTLVDDEAVAYHEGVPGHHMQISIAQRLENLPKFRLHGFYPAYAEGWALYSEELGKEIGFYKDPVSDYGRLSSEMLRAVRLVVDTGIHDKNWSRQQVIDFMHANDVNDALAQTEADRYIAWPAQALAYKMGQLTILKLREEAKAQLGKKFDIKAFHDEILNGGSMPLELLQQRVQAWIKDQAGKKV